jgi:hypothetical protein
MKTIISFKFKSKTSYLQAHFPIFLYYLQVAVSNLLPPHLLLVIISVVAQGLIKLTQGLA